MGEWIAIAVAIAIGCVWGFVICPRIVAAEKRAYEEKYGPGSYPGPM